ncbi:MAG: oligosaccharide flippase family protein [Kofleriaceae bacterium]|nr:oligosaccharide flippase family protein [Kofleriaceae bacterium]
MSQEQPTAPAPVPVGDPHAVPSTETPPPQLVDPAAPAGSSAGRGVLLIAFAKFYFMMIGLIIQVKLPSILSRTTFGAFGVVNAFISPINNVMVTGSIQSVSRFISQEPEKARRVQAAGFRMHLFIGVGVALAFAAAAPVVAAFQHDQSKTLPLMVGALIVAGYSFYAVLVGTANGLRQFNKQAGLDIVFATLRAAGILGAALAGLGVVGVVAGWVAAVGVILLLAVMWIGMPGRTAEAPMSIRPLSGYFAQVAVYLVLFNLLMFADTWLLKRLTTEHFAPLLTAHGDALDRAVPGLRGLAGYSPTASALADGQVAYYTAVQNLARLSYQAIIAATFVVFPLVSRSTFTDDGEITKRYITVTMRYSLMFSMAIAVVMAANPKDILGLVYAADYASFGAPALLALALGNVAFSLFAISGTILNGAGLTRPAIVSAAITLVLAVVGNFIAIPMAASGAGVLFVAAAVTGAAMLAGSVISGIILKRRLGAFLPLLSIVRIVAAMAVAMAVGRLLPLHGKLLTLVEAGIVGIVFLAVLIGSGELGKRDLAAIAQVRKKRATGGGEV